MDLIYRHPSIHELLPSEEAAIHKLFSGKPMNVGGLEINYERMPRFRDLLEAQGTDSHTWCLREHGVMKACGSHSSTSRWIAGRLSKTTYISDLRVQVSKFASKNWRPFIPDLLDWLKREGIEYNLTAILGSNQAAIQALTRKSFSVRYHKIADLWMVNTFGRVLTPKKPENVRRVRTDEKNKLLMFLEEKAKAKRFGFNFPQEYDRREKTWPGFKLENFLVQEEQGQWQAVCLPWSPSKLKKMRVLRAPWLLKKSLSALKILDRRPPKVGEPLETLYLTHFYANETNTTAAAAAFTDFLQSEKVFRDYHMISFAIEQKEQPKLPGLLKQFTRVGAFLMSNEAAPPSLGPAAKLDFEMAVV